MLIDFLGLFANLSYDSGCPLEPRDTWRSLQSSLIISMGICIYAKIKCNGHAQKCISTKDNCTSHYENVLI